MASPKRSLAQPHWKVRFAVRGCGFIHCASSAEPRYTTHGEVVWTPIEGTEYGDTLGFVMQSDLAAVSWRYHPGDTEEEEPEPAGTRFQPRRRGGR